MLGDLNAGVVNEEVLGVVGMHRVLGKNVNGERLVEMCSKMELIIGNMYFKEK